MACGPNPNFVNKVLLHHSHISFTYCVSCFCATVAELSSYDRKLKIVTIGTSQKEFVDHWDGP